LGGKAAGSHPLREAAGEIGGHLVIDGNDQQIQIERRGTSG
jgi:hypothetical protein